MDSNMGTTLGPTKAEDFQSDVPPGEFIWWTGQEPHISRRKEMLAKYGNEIKPLMGYDTRSKWELFLITGSLMAIAILSNKIESWFWFLVTAYLAGTFLTHNLFLAIHEITHNLAASKVWENNLLAMVANIPIVFPYCMAFKVYHAEHHRYLGWDGVDTDLPTEFEAKLFDSFFGKLFFLIFQILFYALRPVLVRPKKPTFWNLVNWCFNLGCDAFIVALFGWTPLLFLLIAVFCAGTIGPLSGHFLSEHYILDPNAKQETYSHYGWENALVWYVGYHTEHHDFPNIPARRLYRLKEIAPEYYNNLITTDSYFQMTMRFLFDPRVSMWSRVVREKGASKRNGPLLLESSAEPHREHCVPKKK